MLDSKCNLQDENLKKILIETGVIEFKSKFTQNLHISFTSQNKITNYDSQTIKTALTDEYFSNTI